MAGLTGQTNLKEESVIKCIIWSMNGDETFPNAVIIPAPVVPVNTI